MCQQTCAMVHTCDICHRNYSTKHGLCVHRGKCAKRYVSINNGVNGSLNETSPVMTNTQVETSDILEAQEINIEHELTILPNLPTFQKAKELNADYCGMTGKEFIKTIDSVYEEIILWRRSLFKLPSGNAAKLFIKELTVWLERFNSKSEHQSIALKVYMILPALLLQKPSKTSKAKDHCKKLEERIAAWKDGKISELLQECRTIQRRLISSPNNAPKDKAKSFAKLVFQGKIHAAMRLLTENDAGIHKLDDKILEALHEKHPKQAPIKPETLLNGPINRVLTSYFDEIDEQMIYKAVSQTKGAGGPSQLDAEQYRHILTSNKYKKENKELRTQISILARSIATEVLDPNSLQSLVACRLIPLDKNPGVRPIGIGEVLRRIIGKSISWVLRKGIQQAAGPLQTATGLQGGAEAAIHSMREIFADPETDAVILVDANNAFNSLNRLAALHNIRIICPEFSTVLINTYRIPVRMLILGGGELMSEEGTTQGDNLAMAFYALGISTVLAALKCLCPSVSQVGLADDITGAAKIPNLRKWWENLIIEGEKSGYYVNESKSWLILKDPQLLNEAQAAFEATGIKLTCEGKRHLGASIGSNDFKSKYIGEKVTDWLTELRRLTEYAKTEPHAAYAIFCRGFIHKFTYFMRTIEGISDHLKPLDEVIKNEFLPTLLDAIVCEEDLAVFSLPVRYGGLGIQMPSEIASEHFESSMKISAPLVTIMILQGDTLPDEKEVRSLKAEVNSKKEEALKRKVEEIEETVSPTVRRSMNDAREPGASSWLSAIPLAEYDFVLNKKEFRDAINLRYGKELKGLPSKCPCGQVYNVTHALNCKTGGFITIRHNKIRDFEAQLLKETCNDVETEPQLQELNGENVGGLTGDNAKPDVRARGFWRDGQNAFFDVRITNTNAPSQIHMTTDKIFEKHEKEKKRQYSKRIMNIEHGTFTPLVFSVHGGMARECSIFHKYLADKIASKTGCRYEKVLSLMKCKLSFLILRASLMCVRGSRSLRTHAENHHIDDFELAFHNALG